MSRSRGAVAAIIMAAGKGTRMGSRCAKVLARAAGRPLLDHVLRGLAALAPERTVLVVGHDRARVRRVFADRGLIFVNQLRQLGTGHAVLMAETPLGDFPGDVLILSGDMPLVRSATLARLLDRHRGAGADLTLLTATVEDPTGLGRIRRDSAGDLEAVVEERDIQAPADRAIREINVGVYAARPPALFRALHRVGNDNVQGEYYLPDAVRVLLDDGRRVIAWDGGDPDEGLGVNSPRELARAGAALRRRHMEALAEAGVTVIDPEHTVIAWNAQIGAGTVIHSHVVIGEGAVIGQDCEIARFVAVPPEARLPDGTRLPR